MRVPAPVRRLLVVLVLYVLFCSIVGIFLADQALHPGRRPLPPQAEAAMRQITQGLDADLEDVSITTSDGVVLSAWEIRPHQANGNAAILLHGVADNRLGMTGYAQLLLRHGFAVLLPDARAHGLSGGDLATYGLLERADIQQWFEFLNQDDHPHCIFGFGESMGAAQLLESLAGGTQFCALVAESSFSNFREIAYDRIGQAFHLGPWVGRTILRPIVEVAFLRARWNYNLKLRAISPEDSVAAAKVPVLLIHGQADRNIPIRHSRQIQSHNPGTWLWEVPNAAHCGAISAAPREFEQQLLGWFFNHASHMN